MHEWALAEAVIAFLMSASHGMRRVRCVKLRIGELYQMDMDIFITALHEIAIAEDSKRFADMKITWEKEKASFKCRHCGNEWNFKRREDDEENEDISFRSSYMRSHGVPRVDVLILMSCVEKEFRAHRRGAAMTTEQLMMVNNPEGGDGMLAPSCAGCFLRSSSHHAETGMLPQSQAL